MQALSKHLLLVLLPGLSTVPVLGASGDPMKLLEEVRPRVRAGLEKAPPYRCTKTVVRNLFTRADSRLSRRTCFDDPERKMQLSRTDRLRLEVIVSDGSERHQWPNSHELEPADVRGFVFPPLSGGTYGKVVASILRDHPEELASAGRAVYNNREVLAYRYKVAKEKSAYLLKASSFEGNLGYSGRFFVDPESFELLRLEVEPEAPTGRIGCLRSPEHR